MSDHKPKETSVAKLFKDNLFGITDCLKMIYDYENQQNELENQIKDTITTFSTSTTQNQIIQDLKQRKNNIRILYIKKKKEHNNLCEVHNSLRQTIISIIYGFKIITDLNIYIECLILFYELLELRNKTPPVLQCNLKEVDLVNYIDLLKFKMLVYNNYIEYMTVIVNPPTKLEQCNICFENPQKIIYTSLCGHTFCEECIYRTIHSSYNATFKLKDRKNPPRCPSCRCEM
jgi:hypothetical protein